MERVVGLTSWFDKLSRFRGDVYENYMCVFLNLLDFR